MAIIPGATTPDQLNENPQECGPRIRLLFSSFKPHRASDDARPWLRATAMPCALDYVEGSHEQQDTIEQAVVGVGLTAPAQEHKQLLHVDHVPGASVWFRPVISPAEVLIRGAGWESVRPRFHRPLTRFL